MNQKIKILIVEDHQLVSEAWKYILKDEENFTVLGVTDSALEAVTFSTNLRPDVILMDVNLKDGNGIDATAQINNLLPKTRIIGLSLHEDMVFVKKFFSNGAKGYLSKNTNKQELVEAINKVYNGEQYIAKELKDRYFSSLMNLDNTSQKKELTLKEIEIVKLISKGLTSKEIADKIFLSPRTVETHRHNILKKLNIPNAAQLTGWAKEKGYI
jgi:DNA-binding NarL/FixJ family response regulator